MNAAVTAWMAAPEVVSTTALLLGAPHAMFKPGMLLAPLETTGAMEAAMEEYISVMVAGRMAEVTGKNFIARVSLAFAAMRSEGEMVKITVEVEAIMLISDVPIKT